MSLSPELLEQLRGAGLMIEAHRAASSERIWFSVRVRDGHMMSDFGPYASEEEALVNGVHRLHDLLTTLRAEREGKAR